MVKPLPAIAGDTRDEGLIPGLGRSRRGGYGNPLQYSCLKNYMDIGAWKAKVHWDAKELDTAEATERSTQHLRIIFGKHFLYKTSSVGSWLFCLRKGADLLTLPARSTEGLQCGFLCLCHPLQHGQGCCDPIQFRAWHRAGGSHCLLHYLQLNIKPRAGFSFRQGTDSVLDRVACLENA